MATGTSANDAAIAVPDVNAGEALRAMMQSAAAVTIAAVSATESR
jgi:hypothetical protein